MRNRTRRSAPLAVVALPALIGCLQAGGLARQNEWMQMHPEAPAQIKQAVLGKKLIQGMSTDAVQASWGEPDEKLDLGGGDARWTYTRRQSLSGIQVDVEYTLVFNGDALIRIHRQKTR